MLAQMAILPDPIELCHRIVATLNMQRGSKRLERHALQGHHAQDACLANTSKIFSRKKKPRFFTNFFPPDAKPYLRQAKNMMTSHLVTHGQLGISSPNVATCLCATRASPSCLASLHQPKSLHSPHEAFSLASSSRLKLVSRPRLAEESWVRAGFCVWAVGGERDPAIDTGFQRKKLAAFVSGGGSNFQILHQASLQNKIFGDFVLVVSDKPGCKACHYAESNNILVAQYPYNKALSSEMSPVELVAMLRKFDVDIVLLAGYLKLLPKEVVQAFPRAILNIHPALLPAFGGKGYYGIKVHEAVIKSGARYSGPTIHFVDERYDHGLIVAQRIVPVLPYDTPEDLAARVLKEEHLLYPEVVAAICEDRIFWREDGIPLIRRSWDEAEYY